MQNQINLQPAYLLHSRPFRDTSLLLDFLTRDYGRFSAIAKGVRRAGARNKGLLQPFIPLQISVFGKRELKTLRNVELMSDVVTFKGERLFSALYINELMVRLVHANEAEANLFLEYEKTLGLLQTGPDIEPVLRRFEINLLQILGYGIEFGVEAESGDAIVSSEYYFFQIESGFIRIDRNRLNRNRPEQDQNYFSGEEIIRISGLDFSEKQTRKAAKQLLRYVLGIYLGEKPLKSRQLFTAL